MDFLFRTINSYVHDHDERHLVILSNLTDFAHIFEVILKIDIESKKIVETKAKYYKTPYNICKKTVKLIDNIKGMEIKKGVIKDIANKLSGTEGCIHLFELVENAIKLASTIIIGKKANYFTKEFRSLPDEEKIKISKKYLKNTCYAYTHTKE
ncbi:MAG: DUF2889 domain-containing protein [Proteobacteria bacterium]|nr:DUF2889 domain-containing protein [Pseudomonadota bacterium]